MHSLITTSLFKARDAVQFNLNNAFGAMQYYVFKENPDEIRLTGNVNTKYPTMSEKRTLADYKKSVEGYPDIDANKIKVRDKTEAAKRESDKLEHSLPILSERQQRKLQETADISLVKPDAKRTEAAKRESDKLEHSLPILSERQQRQLQETADINPVNVDAKRMASEDQKEKQWIRYDPYNFKGGSNSVSALWRKLNPTDKEYPLYTDTIPFSEHNVVIDYTALPNCVEDAFTHPVLVDERMRLLYPSGFDKLANQLKGNSYSLCPTPHDPYYYGATAYREAVPVLVRESSDCNSNGIRSVASFLPASCKSFGSGDLIAQIDQFFAENRTKDNVGCVVFVDVETIDRWVKESSFLQELDNPIVLAIRLDDRLIKNINLLAGYALGCTGLVIIVLGIACRNKIKDKCSSITCFPSGHPENSAQRAADTPDNNATANPDFVENDGAVDNSRSPYLGDSSFSSKEEEEDELQAIVIASKRTDGNVSGGSGGKTSEEED